MSGLSYTDQIKWRNDFENILRSRCDKSLTFVHPPLLYQYSDVVNDKEMREWEISQLKDSDIVVVDLTTIADSIKTHIELGIIEAMNEFGYKHIHVIGVGKSNINHPWIQMEMLRREDTIEDAVDYISTYLLL